jgi:extradiol dioxygenase family protein
MIALRPISAKIPAIGSKLAVVMFLTTLTFDLLHWQTTLVTRSIARLSDRLQTGGVCLVSPDVVRLAEGQPGFTAGLLVRDPDGHAMQVIERSSDN